MVKGGKREGAGRPRIGDNRTQVYSVTLWPEIAEVLKRHGGGNLSAGVRLMGEMLLAEEEENGYVVR